MDEQETERLKAEGFEEVEYIYEDGEKIKVLIKDELIETECKANEGQCFTEGSGKCSRIMAEESIQKSEMEKAIHKMVQA